MAPLKTFLAALAVLILAACIESPPPPMSVNDRISHPSARATSIQIGPVDQRCMDAMHAYKAALADVSNTTPEAKLREALNIPCPTEQRQALGARVQ